MPTKLHVTMETCGFIMSKAGEFESYLMRCSHCLLDIEIEKWQEFVLHIQNTHTLISKYIPIEQVAMDRNSDKEESLEAPIEEDIELNAITEVDFERPSSGMSVSSLSENATAMTSESNGQSADEEGQEATSYSLTYNFNPSFFRRDPRTLVFIDTFKSQPCLWNPGYSKYKDSTACKAAYGKIITELETKICVLFSERTLKAAIKKFQSQYSKVETHVNKGNIKPNSVAFNHYTSCDFLKSCQDQTHLLQDEMQVLKNSVIQLNFSQRNVITTDFIELYANFPQLYDNKHNDFSNVISRKQAYEAMAAKTSVPNKSGVSKDDIYQAIEYLRRWYYKSEKNMDNESEQFYVKACAFLPPKSFKPKLNCSLCQQESYSEHVHQAHMFKVHNIGELPFKCNSCERSFMGRAELATHMQRAHIGKTHKCNYCDSYFAVSADLRSHIRTHTGKNHVLCEQCGKAFRLKSQMKQHVVAIHTKVRAYKCTMCPKDFVRNVHLTDHIKSHLNIRDKICATCGKGFTSSHSLIRHRQIHSEIKKFVCKLCDARFSQFVGLNSHMKRTHNILRNNAQNNTHNTASEETIC